MKRNYVKPTIETVEMELLSIIASSSLNEGEMENEGMGEGEGDGDDLINHRRGPWGNLWSSEE